MEVKDLPLKVRRAVNKYKEHLRGKCQNNRKTYGKLEGCSYCLHTKSGAEDMCLEASAEFLPYLDRAGIRTSDDNLREYIFEARDPDERRRQKKDTYLMSFPFNSTHFSFHFVVKVDDLIIDWTSRQFDETSSFPTIWREDQHDTAASRTDR